MWFDIKMHCAKSTGLLCCLQMNVMSLVANKKWKQFEREVHQKTFWLILSCASFHDASAWRNVDDCQHDYRCTDSAGCSMENRTQRPSCLAWWLGRLGVNRTSSGCDILRITVAEATRFCTGMNGTSFASVRVLVIMQQRAHESHWWVLSMRLTPLHCDLGHCIHPHDNCSHVKSNV